MKTLKITLSLLLFSTFLLSFTPQQPKDTTKTVEDLIQLQEVYETGDQITDKQTKRGTNS